MSIDPKQLSAMRSIHNLIRKEGSPLNVIGTSSTVQLPFEVLFPFTQKRPDSGSCESAREGCQEGQSDAS
jgi:hypothetical protein